MPAAERPRTSSPRRAATLVEVVGAELVALDVDARTDPGVDDGGAEAPHGRGGGLDHPGIEPPPPGVGGADDAFGAPEHDRQAVGGLDGQHEVGVGGDQRVGIDPARPARGGPADHLDAGPVHLVQPHPGPVDDGPAARPRARRARRRWRSRPGHGWWWRRGRRRRRARCVRATGPGGRRLLQERRDVEVVAAAVEVEIVVVVGAEHVGDRLEVGPAGPARRRALARPVGLGVVPAVEAGGDDRDPDLVAHLVVDDGAEDDVGVGVGHAVDDLGRLVDLEQAEVAATGDGEQDAAGALDGGLEQRAGDGGPGRVERPTLARAVADAHEGGAGVAHDHLHVGEVGVDQARRGDEVGDALHALQQHLVGHLERVEHRGLLVGDGEQAVVGDDDEGVDLLLQLLDAGLGLHRAAAALEAERAGDHADGERADAPWRSRR